MKSYRFKFDPSKKGLRQILGELEADIMDLIWEKGECSVRAVYSELSSSRGVAYTTVMTVMSRLVEKGVLKRRKESGAFYYSPVTSKENFTKSVVSRVMEGLLRDFAQPTIHQFLDSVEDTEPQTIEELSRLLKEKRKKND